MIVEVSPGLPCLILSSERLTESGNENRSLRSGQQSRSSVADTASPIAADGGFGPMVSDDSDEEESDDPVDRDGGRESAQTDKEEGFGDDFDDFEAGADDDDFGDFDEGIASQHEEISHSELKVPSIQSLAPIESPFVSCDWSLSTIPFSGGRRTQLHH